MYFFNSKTLIPRAKANSSASPLLYTVWSVPPQWFFYSEVSAFACRVFDFILLFWALLQMLLLLLLLRCWKTQETELQFSPNKKMKTLHVSIEDGPRVYDIERQKQFEILPGYPSAPVFMCCPPPPKKNVVQLINAVCIIVEFAEWCEYNGSSDLIMLFDSGFLLVPNNGDVLQLQPIVVTPKKSMKLAITIL